MNQDVSRLLFPKEEINKDGYLIGFNQKGFNINIIYIDNQNSLEQIDQRLENNRLQMLKRTANGELLVIGKSMKTYSLDQQEQNKIKVSNIWINIETDINNNDSFFIRELFIYGYRYKTNTQVVFYDGRIKEQLLSLNINEVQKKLFDYDFQLQNFLKQNDSSKIQSYLENKIENENIFENEFDLNTSEYLEQLTSSKTTIENTPNKLHELQMTIRQLNLRNIYKELYLEQQEKRTKKQKRQCLTDSWLKVLLKVFIYFLHLNKALYLCWL